MKINFNKRGKEVKEGDKLIEVKEAEDGLGEVDKKEELSHYFALWNKEQLIRQVIQDSKEEANMYFKLGGTYSKVVKERKKIESEIKSGLEDLGVEEDNFRVEANGKIVEGKTKEVEDSYIG